MNIKKILFLFLIFFAYLTNADSEVEEKVEFRIGLGVGNCLVDNPKKCGVWYSSSPKEMILKGDSDVLYGTLEFSETALGTTYSAKIIAFNGRGSYEFYIKFIYFDGEKIIETKFSVFAPTPKEINRTQVDGQPFQDSEFLYQPFFVISR